MNVNVVLYENFTALDVFGPVEVLSNIHDYQIQYYSWDGGIVSNDQNIRIETEAMDRIESGGIILIPGGFGSRIKVDDDKFITALKNTASSSEYILCVCTGSALLAKTGLLDGRYATSNKAAFEWVKNCGPGVRWIKEVRWVVDRNIYTSAGVSAGTDMTLGFVRDLFGEEKAREICNRMEYHWNADAEHDSF